MGYNLKPLMMMMIERWSHFAQKHIDLWSHFAQKHIDLWSHFAQKHIDLPSHFYTTHICRSRIILECIYMQNYLYIYTRYLLFNHFDCSVIWINWIRYSVQAAGLFSIHFRQLENNLTHPGYVYIHIYIYIKVD